MGSVPRQEDGNLGPPMLEISWTLAAVAIIIVILRVLTRVKGKRGLRLDDHFMILSLVRQCQLFSDLATLLIISRGLWGDQYSSHQHCSFLGLWKTPDDPRPKAKYSSIQVQPHPTAHSRDELLFWTDILRIFLGRDCSEVCHADKISLFACGPSVPHQRIYRHTHYGTVQTSSKALEPCSRGSLFEPSSSRVLFLFPRV